MMGLVVVLAILACIVPLGALVAYVAWMQKHIGVWLAAMGAGEEEE